MMMCNHQNLYGTVYYTSKLSVNIEQNRVNEKIQYIKLPIEQKNVNRQVIEMKPYDYQKEASEKIINHLNTKNKAILGLPCGCGKTYASYLVAQKYKTVIILSPLKQFAKQNLDKYIEYGYNHRTILVDSDGTRDINEIKKIFEESEGILISATYRSVDIIHQIIDNIENALIIIDEFHNLSKANIIDTEDNFNKLLNSNKKFLMMSATPRVYELEDDDCYDNIDDYLGEVVYSMSFTNAIKDGYITDYKIYLPSIQEENGDLITEISSEIDVKDIDNETKGKSMYLLKCILHNGSKKCIIYCQDLNEIDLMKKSVEELNKYYLLDLNTQIITSDVSYKNRQQIINTFTNSKKIELLFSVRIMDECIDIPSCDSIFITYASNSKIRTIQRMCRCIRVDNKNKFKVGNVYIWCNEYDKILKTLSSIKEYDVMFKDKISVLETNWTKKGNQNKTVENKKMIEKYMMDIKEFRIISWDEKFKELCDYLDKYQIRPSSTSEDRKIKKIGLWTYNQMDNYTKKTGSMRIEERRQIWDELVKKYSEIIMDNDEKWARMYHQVCVYIDEHQKGPNIKSNDPKTKMIAKWMYHQNYNYKKCTSSMRIEERRQIWKEFVEKYKDIITNVDERWIEMYEKVKGYIDEHQERPCQSSKDIEIKNMAMWLNHQQVNYKKGNSSMSTEERRQIWLEFTNKYKEIFMDANEKWNQMYRKTCVYIDEYGKRPSTVSKDLKIKSMGSWIDTQLNNYNNKIKSMRTEEGRQIWFEFMNKYKEIFMDANEKKWNQMYHRVWTYIDDHDREKLNNSSDDPQIKTMNNWLRIQQLNYKKKTKSMKTEERRQKWEKIISKCKKNEYIYFETIS